MDRTSKIAIAICLVGVGVNIWWGITHPLPPQPIVDSRPAVAETSPASGATTQGAANPSTPAAAPAPAPAAGSIPTEAPFEITSGPVTYTFTNQGGGILKVVSHSATGGIEVELNKHAKAPIAALSSAVKSTADQNYKVVEKSNAKVVFERETDTHLVVRKEFILPAGKEANPHLVQLKLTLTNKGEAALTPDGYYLYAGASASTRPNEIIKPSFLWNDAGDTTANDTNAFREGSGFLGFGGPILDIQKSFQRLRWAGSMSRFDALLLISDEKDDQPGKIWTERFTIDHSADEFKDISTKDYAIHGGASLPPVPLEPNTPHTFSYKIYMGPKIYRDLSAIDDDGPKPDYQTRFVMMYGWFTMISAFLVRVMRLFYSWFGNWGAAIILLTCCIRTFLWYPQSRANATMKKMGLLSPKMKELQEKYKDDPTKMNTEVMKLYRDYGVNPLGGCLPMLVQIPIFFGFYRVLQSAAELRGQSWLWVKDLSMPDTVTHIMGYPLNILPLLMGVSMILQMKLTPQPAAADKTQANIMKFMPLIFLYISYNFASALALYWTAQNLFNIMQSRITRLYQKDPVLEKVARPALSAAAPGSPAGLGNGTKPKKDKPSPPRPGGGGTKSRGK
jgi:YidC/Oxa1 family membrane protein insertase